MVWMLIGYMWLFIHRPFEIWPVLATIQIERIYVLTAIAATLFTTRGMVQSSLNRAWLVFAGAVLLCWMASPWRDTAVAGLQVTNWFKILVFYYLVVLNIRTEQELRLLIIGFAGVISLFMLHSIWEFHQGRRTFRMGIARMNGINILFRHPNSFGTTLVCALPFFGMLCQVAASRWVRYASGLSILGVLYSVINTGSRSCMVGVLAAAGLVAIRSPHRGKFILAAAALLPLIWTVIPSDKQARFLSLVTDSVSTPDSRSAQVSADARTEGFYEGWRLFQDHPWTGVGPGAWIPATGWSIESHNLYGQLPGEMGLLGLIAFALVLASYWHNLRSARQVLHSLEEPNPFLERLVVAIGDSTILLLILGMAGHNLFRFNWVWHAAFLAVAVHVAHAQYADQGYDEDHELDDDDAWDDRLDFADEVEVCERALDVGDKDVAPREGRP